MKPRLLPAPIGSLNSFSITHENTPTNNNFWHCHPEVELIHFRKGKGLQFVGDSIRPFKEGNMVLIGAELPHFWHFDDSYKGSDATVPKTDIRVLHFKENFWGNGFLNLPENKRVKITLEGAKRGIEIAGDTKKTIGRLLEEIYTSEGTNRIIILLEILDHISQCNELNLLSSMGFGHQKAVELEDDRINAIYEFSFINFKRKVKLEEVAEVACLCPNYFYRFFKSQTGKTYTQFLNEIKVGHVCKLLIENKGAIQQISFESGFNNFASFYKCFKACTGKSPLVYQKEYLKKNYCHPTKFEIRKFQLILMNLRRFFRFSKQTPP